MKSTILSLLVLLGSFVPHKGQASRDFALELQNAQQALSASHYDKAFTEYRRFAKQHKNPLAQFSLGLFHENGWGRPVDRVEACRWFEKAAYGGITTAHHFFANCLAEGVHRQANPEEAAKWFEKAAAMGHSPSLCPLAKLYLQGRGVTKDTVKGLEYCRQAALSEHRPAQLQMGRFLLEGDQSIRDPVKASAWFEKAAQKGSLEAAYYLGKINQDYLENQESALFWFEFAASQGYVPAYHPTAGLYFNAPLLAETGMPSETDLAKAYLWLSASEKQSTNSRELAETKNMLKDIKHIMPETWKPDLDNQVAQHLTRYAH